MGKTSEKSSNIQLLRIVIILMVIVLHYNYRDVGGASAYADRFSLYIIKLTESLSICAVDIFVIISGFFSIEKRSRKAGKVFSLFAWVIFYQLFFTLIALGGAVGSITGVKKIIRSFYPVNYYVYLYSALYLISPFLNQMVEKMDPRKYRKMLIVLLILFSLQPSFSDGINDLAGIGLNGVSTVSLTGSGAGYSIINFIMLYLIGGYIRKYSSKTNEKSNVLQVSLLVYLLTSLIIWGESFFFDTSVAWSYCNIFVIIQASSLFMFFQHLSINYNRYINYIAESVFGVFLIHEHILGKITEITGVEKAAVNMATLLGNMLVSVLICFSVSVLIDIFWRKIFSGLGYWGKKTKLFNYEV